MKKEKNISEIYLDAPDIGELEKEYLVKALETGYVSSVGPFVPDFEKSFSEYLSVERSVSTQSGTAAIHMALHELGIGPGDEVIVPALTFVATVNPILYVGANPVFVDVDLDTWNMAPDKIKDKISSRTKAIIPVHLYGNPCAMDRIMEIGRDNNIHIIEDATESLGALFDGSYTGTFGDFGCFSFNGNKVVTTGGGGMLVGKDLSRLEHVSHVLNQAKTPNKEGFHNELGFNYRMTNLEAALGLAQIDRIDKFMEKKKKFNEIYRDMLEGLECLSFQAEYDSGTSSFWLTCVLFEKNVEAAEVRENLMKVNVPTRRPFVPISEFKYLSCDNKKELNNSYYIYDKGLCLPGSTLNDERDIIDVCNKLIKLLKTY